MVNSGIISLNPTSMTSLETFNQSIFLLLNADSATPAWKIGIAALMADFLIYFIPLVLVGQWCWGSEKQRELAFKACVIAFLALGVNQLLSIVWPHPRPLAMGLGHTFILHANDSSFPSDHATVFAAIGLTFVFENIRSKAGWTVLFLGTWVAWARLFLGVHFPLDMIGALFVVVAVWLGVGPIWRSFGTKLTSRAEGAYRLVLARPIALGWIRR